MDATMAAIEERLLKSSPGAPVESLSWELITDSNGYGAVEIVIILKDNKRKNPYPLEKLQPIDDLIWEKFVERGLDRWPFIRYFLRSEIEEIEKEEAEEAAKAIEAQC